jgi:hypothetical protein
MNQQQFLARLEELYKENADYASDGDPFLNFRACEMFGIPAEQALIVRMSDKLMRCANLLTREAQVKDESMLDTLSDLANYAMILRMYLEQKHDTRM